MNTFIGKQIKKNSNEKLNGNNLKKHYISNKKKTKIYKNIEYNGII